MLAVVPLVLNLVVCGAPADVAGQSRGHVGDVGWDWDRFERQFAAYVASEAERGSEPRPEERAG